MSEIEYNNLLFEISQRLDELDVLERLLFMCRGKLAPGSDRQYSIQDTLSLFKELENRSCLGVDRLQVLKDLLKGVREWSLFGKVKKFESTRIEYNGLIEHIILVLDELNDMERLISICRMEIAEANETSIRDVRSLFKELENNDCLGIDCLTVLKEILTKTEQRDLLREVEGLEARRNRQDEFESRKAQVADFMTSVGNKLKGVLTIKTVFKVVAGGLTVASTLEVLSRGSTFDQLVTGVNKCVLPAGTSLTQITEGCVCLTVQAENLSSLETLWSLYKDGTLKVRLQTFFVTDEIRELAGGEQVEVIVTIEEEEYQKAFSELSTEIQGLGSNGFGQGRTMRVHRRNSDSSLYCKIPFDQGPKQTPVPTELPPTSQSGYLDHERLAFVQNYLEKAEDARSMTTETSDSGIQGTRGTPSEFGLEDASESPYKLHLKDLSKQVTAELSWRFKSDPVAEKWFYEAFGLTPTKPFSNPVRNISELFPDTPLRLLKDVFEAVQLNDVVDVLEKVKPRTLRPALPLKEIKKLSSASNRPTKFYSKVSVFLLVSEAGLSDGKIQRIGSFFKDFHSWNTVTTGSVLSFTEVCERLRRLQGGQMINASRWILTTIEELKFEILIKEGYYHRSALSSVEDDLAKEMNRRALSLLKKELEQYKEMRQMKKKDMKQIREKYINQTMEELLKEEDKLKVTLNKWICAGEQSVLHVVCTDDDLLPNEDVTRMVKETLQLIPDAPKLVIIPKLRSRYRVTIPETLLVEFPSCERESFQATLLEILSKRWQTSDLISIMHEVQRTFTVKNVENNYPGYLLDDPRVFSWNVHIQDSLSSLPRLQKTEEISE